MDTLNPLLNFVHVAAVIVWAAGRAEVGGVLGLRFTRAPPLLGAHDTPKGFDACAAGAPHERRSSWAR